MIVRSLVVIALAGCCALAGCDGECNDCGWRPEVLDSGRPDAAVTCDPLTQTHCSPGEKCTWILDALQLQYVGHIGCAPDGVANLGDPCMYGAPGATGYDACKKGAMCGDYRGGIDVCKHICNLQGDRPMCDATQACALHRDLFYDDRRPPTVGICE